ncbi:hypothetical protein ACLMJK_008997 [Lecanora helva]
MPDRTMGIPQSETLPLGAQTTTAQEVEATEKAPEQGTTLYPKIHKLSDFIHRVKRSKTIPRLLESIHLTGSTKLHGTHADIVFLNSTDKIRLQSRNQVDISVNKDNVGFAAFIAATEKKVLFDLRDRVLDRYHELEPGKDVSGDLVISGEWCGIGIQKKVAIATIPKFFVIISICINNSWEPDWKYADIFYEDARIFHIGKAGFFTHELMLNDIDTSEAKIKELTDAVEKECPFAKALGVFGLGEGIVWKATEYCSDPRYWFKTKGDQTAVSHSSKLPASAVDKASRQRIDHFAKAIVTENRLEQGWNYLEQKDASGLGLFLKWLTNDCYAEEKLEMEKLSIARSKLNPAINAIARPWFLARPAQAGKE